MMHLSKFGLAHRKLDSSMILFSREGQGVAKIGKFHENQVEYMLITYQLTSTSVNSQSRD
jgi:hypothetical protein